MFWQVSKIVDDTNYEAELYELVHFKFCLPRWAYTDNEWRMFMIRRSELAKMVERIRLD